MNTKADLKAAREAIGAKKFGEAVKACKRVLMWESQNYNAWVFLGVAHTNLEQDEEAEEAYDRAIEINPDSMLAWQGLLSFYEKRNKTEKLVSTIEKLMPRAIETQDGAKLADYLKKLLNVYKTENDEKNHLETLKLFLPQSKYYELIKDQPNLPDPLQVWTTIIASVEKETSHEIDAEVQARRFRVSNLTPAQVREQVESECYARSKLDTMYQNAIDIQTDPVQVKACKIKLLHLYSKKLLAVTDKKELYDTCMTLAKELKDEDDPLSLELLIESTNVDSPEKYDWDMINDLMTRFPDVGLSKIAKGYRLTKEEQIDEAFDLFSDGLEMRPNSLFGYQCLSWTYYNSKEYDTGLEYATKGRDLVKKYKTDTGILLTKVLISMEIIMANCYRLLDKKYYIDAITLYKNIIARSPNEMMALEGLALILSDEHNNDEALKYFQKVQELDPTNHVVVAGMGWVYALKEDYNKAIEYIKKSLEIAGQDVAEYYYRLGRVYWMTQDYESAFKYFMQSVKSDAYFAGGFTYLGHYYRKVKHDHARAKKCYQKAYVLDPLDTDAALNLSDYYIQENQVDEAESIFVHVTETSPRTGWAWRRTGYLNLNSKSYSEAISCFQKALRTDTNDVRCWEGLAEAYSRAGRFVAALRAFERATKLDPTSVHAHCEHAYVLQKVGQLDEAILGFQHTLELAKEQGIEQYIPALVGLSETCLEHAKEDYQQGFFGRAADRCSHVIQTALRGLTVDPSILTFWKLVGDACYFFRIIPSYIHLCDYASLQGVIKLTSQPHEQLKLPADLTTHWINEFLALDDVASDFSLPPKVALDVILSCAANAFKQVIVLCKNHQAIAPAFWNDMGLVYYTMYRNGAQDEVLVAMQCIKVALKLDPTEYLYWNSLGVIASASGAPKVAQYAFIKAIEYNSKSAIPWTNYGFLCLSCQDYELANQAFETAHSLDPEWISAWVGQAHVASLWGTDSADIFEHAFESSNGSSMNASYGYAYSVFNALKDSTDLLKPTFALQKLTEQKINDAVSLNLLGLFLERLGQYNRAAEVFASTILALEAQMEDNKITQEEGALRLSKVHTNLSRALCASGDFGGAIASFESSQQTSVYSQLNAGIAYYFTEQLEASLSMFEMALDTTQDDITLRQDVIVLLSKVLWALGGDEQRAVAKDQLFSSISENPNYLPAIFSLCVMGILEEDATLTTAALQELAKIERHMAFDFDKEYYISWLFSKFYEIQGDSDLATRALIKSIHQTPFLASVWSRLSTRLVQLEGDCNTMTSSALIMTCASKSRTAQEQSLAYENAAISSGSIKKAQRSVMTAPWRLSAWQVLANSC